MFQKIPERTEAMTMPRIRWTLGLVLILMVFSRNAFGSEVLVAAASDLSFPMKEIVATFERKTGHTVKLTLGSSGTFQAQITNGAPFDVFLSADIDYVRQLEKLNLVEAGTAYVYAIGHIVIWVPNHSSIDVGKLGMQSLVHESAKKVAIANPEHAPYGRAAVAAIEHFKVYDRVKPHLVLGENIAQAAQFVSSGAADIGIIALSLAISDPMRTAGRYWEIPLDSYPRMDQGMAILKQARKAGHYEAAKAFHDWITTGDSRAVLKKFGFFFPENAGH